MTIHHATIKRAATLGIILTEKDSAVGTYTEALWPEKNKRLTHKDPKQAVAAMQLAMVFHNEYPNLIIEESESGWEISARQGPDGDPVTILNTDKVPELGEVLDLTHEFDVDPEIGYEEEVRAQVVPERYKQEYAKRGNRDHCGDWIAKQLAGLFDGEDGKFDADAFTAFLILNEVDMNGKWAGLPTSGQKGWVGRYRMNGRQKLELRVAKTGYFVHQFNGEEVKKHKAPHDFLLELAKKHPKIEAEWAE